MADLVITATDVEIGSNATRITTVQAEEAVDAGEVGRVNSTTNKYPLANATTADDADVKGIFVSSASLDGYAVIATSGPVILGSVLTQGVAYYLSDTDGKIRPVADISPGEFVTILGIASSSTTLELDINASGVAAA